MRGFRVSILIAAIAVGTQCQEFEAVSVKPNTGTSNNAGSSSDHGRFTATNVTLRNLILTAYGMKEYGLEGPDWLNSERFDVVAKFPEALSGEKYTAELHAMMQRMLADRFKLAVHRDLKTFSVYGVVVGKNGIKFAAVPDKGSHERIGRTHFEGTSVSMATFAEFLSGRMDRPVLDMSGLKGAYNITLDWTPDSRQSGETDVPLADSQAKPALPQAIQEQLGLRLETSRASLEVLIVDHAERVPTEN
jgi:uncharacterized protein (TIGR03435 family)